MASRKAADAEREGAYVWSVLPFTMVRDPSPITVGLLGPNRAEMCPRKPYTLVRQLLV